MKESGSEVIQIIDRKMGSGSMHPGPLPPPSIFQVHFGFYLFSFFNSRQIWTYYVSFLSYIHPSIHVHHSSIHFHSFIHSFSFIRPFIFIHPYSNSSIHFHLFIHSFSFIHPFIFICFASQRVVR